MHVPSAPHPPLPQGIPPKWAVEKLHAAGILVMNMVGSPKHVPKALEAGVDLICAQV